MSRIDKHMDFDVYTDLRNKSTQYNIRIDLENEVDSQTREAAIALSGAIVRNHYKNLYEGIHNDKDLSKLIKEKLNVWLPKETEFVANEVNISKKVLKTRG